MANFNYSLGFDIPSENTVNPTYKYKGGFPAGYQLPAPHFNWIVDKTSKAIDELQKKKFDLGGVYSDDMNELVSSGQYRLHNNTNLPPNSYYGQAFVGRGAIGADTVVQIVVSYSGHKMYYRGGRYQNDKWIWEEWSEIYSTNNNPYAQNLNGVLPIPKGGTGATDRKTAFSNLAFLGTAPISAVTDDTPEKWTDVGTGYAWYNPADKIIDKPSDYAILINLVHGADLTQFWIVQPLGRMYKRSGSVQSGWNGTWFKAYDEKNKPTPAEIGAAEAVKHKLITYSSLADIGLTAGSETIANIVSKMADNSILVYQTDSASANIYPHSSLVVTVKRVNTNRVEFFATRVNGSQLWFGNYLKDSGWTGWKEIYHEGALPTPAQIGAATSGHGHALTDGGITGTLPINKGGTGASNVDNARTNLGFIIGTYSGNGNSDKRTITTNGKGSIVFIWGNDDTKGFLTPNGGVMFQGELSEGSLWGNIAGMGAYGRSTNSDRKIYSIAYYQNGAISLLTNCNYINKSGVTYTYYCL